MSWIVKGTYPLVGNTRLRVSPAPRGSGSLPFLSFTQENAREPGINVTEDKRSACDDDIVKHNIFAALLIHCPPEQEASDGTFLGWREPVFEKRTSRSIPNQMTMNTNSGFSDNSRTVAIRFVTSRAVLVGR